MQKILALRKWTKSKQLVSEPHLLTATEFLVDSEQRSQASRTSRKLAANVNISKHVYHRVCFSFRFLCVGLITAREGSQAP